MKDIDQIRRDNLRLLEREAGSPTSAAKWAGMSLAQFANLRDGAKDSKTGKPRGMRKDTARKIEASAGKPTGWLDVDHSASVTAAFSPEESTQVPWPLPAIPREKIEALAKDPAKLERLQGAICLALEQIERDMLVAGKPRPKPAPIASLDDVADEFPTGPRETMPWEPGWKPSDDELPRLHRISTEGGVVANVSAGEPHAANDKFEKVPELAEVRLAAGAGIENDQEIETGTFQFRKSFLRSVGADGGRARVVYAKGDSMEPVIQDGAALLVVPSDALTLRDLAAGGVYALNIDGKMIVKTVARDRISGRWVARSFNARHPDIPLEGEASVRVLGRVVWAGSPLREDQAGQWVRR